MLSDIRFTLRHFGRSRGFVTLVILSVSVGIAANVSMFSLLHSALFRALPYPHADRLMQLWSAHVGGDSFEGVPGPTFKTWRENAKVVESISLVSRFAGNLLDGGGSERVDGLSVSASYLQVFGVAPESGRDFATDEDQVGRDSKILIITHEWWQSRFGGDPNIIGRKLWLQKEPYQVVGVLPAQALLDEDVSFLTPLVLEDAPWKMSYDTPWARVVARLKPNVTIPKAQSELAAITSEYNRIHPTPGGGYTVRVFPLQDRLAFGAKSTLLLLSCASVGLLLVVCVNLAILLLARSNARATEIAVRLALGATRARILRQILTESVILAMLGGIVGIAMTAALMGAVRHATVGILARTLRPEFDLSVLLAALGFILITGILFGVLPAWRLRTIDLNSGLKEEGRGFTGGRRVRTSSLLLIMEIVLAVMLLAGTGLLLRSFNNVLKVDIGFRVDHALVGDLTLNIGGAESIVRYEDEAVRQLEALPGVDSAGITTTLPLGDNDWGGVVTKPESSDPRVSADAAVVYVGGDYFRALGLRLLKGRMLTRFDNHAGAAPVVVVNERLASDIFGAENPLGRRIRLDHATTWEIVGVVADVRDTRLDHPARGRFYAAHIHSPWAASVIVRTSCPPTSLIESVRNTLSAVDRDQSIANIRTLETAVDRSLGPRKLTLTLVAVFASVAIALAFLGIYSVTSYAVAQRSRELTIRMALGADRSVVVGMVLKHAIQLGAAGVAAGLIGVLVAAPLISTQLFGVKTYDPGVFISVGIIALGMSFVAAIVPAIRVARGDLAEQLRRV